MNGQSSKVWARMALVADMIPGFVLVTIGLAVAVAGAFPQVLALA